MTNFPKKGDFMAEVELLRQCARSVLSHFKSGPVQIQYCRWAGEWRPLNDEAEKLSAFVDALAIPLMDRSDFIAGIVWVANEVLDCRVSYNQIGVDRNGRAIREVTIAAGGVAPRRSRSELRALI